MNNRTTRGRRRSCRVLVAAILIAGIGGAAEAATTCREDPDYAQVEIDISYTMVSETRLVEAVNVKPEVTKIYRQGSPNKVCWIVPELDSGLTLRITGKQREDNPKPFGATPIVASEGEAMSGEPAATGRWYYNVTIEGGPKPFVKDPVVVIDPGSGSSVQRGEGG